MEIEFKAVDADELWRRFKEDGDERAREQLVVVYSPLVKYLAGRVGAKLPSHVESADLISYGLVGLIQAIERFDLSQGAQVPDLCREPYSRSDYR
jgi:RNA polymerase sigma factor for flagellar operon FliA